MIVKFFDRENELNPFNGTHISEDKKLLDVIENNASRAPFFCELVGENGCNLLLGIGGLIACAQYSRRDGKPPYLMATTAGSKQRNEDVEFLTGGTLTPVPARYCLPLNVVKKIAVFFQKTGEASPAVEWEEI